MADVTSGSALTPSGLPVGDAIDFLRLVASSTAAVDLESWVWDAEPWIPVTATVLVTGWR